MLITLFSARIGNRIHRLIKSISSDFNKISIIKTLVNQLRWKMP